MATIKIKGKTYTYADFLSRMKGRNPEWVRGKKQKKLIDIKRGETASFWNVRTKKSLVLGDGLTGSTHVFLNGKGLKVFKDRKKAKNYILKRLKKRKPVKKRRKK